MIKLLLRLAVVCGIIAAIALTDRAVSPPSGRGDTLLSEYDEELPETAGVPFPSFATGFSVFLGAETDDFDYPKKTSDLLDRLASLNVNSVAIVFSVFQDGPEGSEVYTVQGSTPTDASLELFIRAAHARGISVMMRPTLDEANLRSVDRWRGQIEPGDVDRWFSTYSDLIVHYAELAETEQVASVSVGVEFESMEQYHDQWRSLIGSVREVYSGLVTYSFNFQRQDIGFVDALDFVGLDAYYPLDASTGATVEQLDAAWLPAVDALRRLETATKKEVVLTEVGLRSQSNSFRDPFQAHANETVSVEDQKNYYASMCNLISTAVVSPNGATLRAAADPGSAMIADLQAGASVQLVGTPVMGPDGAIWQTIFDPSSGKQGFVTNEGLSGRPIYGGSYVWFAYLNALTIDPATDQDYPPFNKPAEPVLRQCYADRLGLTDVATPIATPE
jgi:hypothetical protein